jgi:hypothetical protein
MMAIGEAAMSGAVTSIERRRLRGTRGILQSVQTKIGPNKLSAL